jgi:hypothetical protein
MQEKAYKNPYLMGFFLGLTLLFTFYVTGHGLGASGAFYRLLAVAAHAVFPNAAGGVGYLERAMSFLYRSLEGPHPNHSLWLIYEGIGVMAGAFISGLIGGRVKWQTIKGETAESKTRLLFALGGGILLGFSSKLTLGCTSGQGLSGASLLSVGSWIFLLSVFAGGFMAAWFVRKQYQ